METEATTGKHWKISLSKIMAFTKIHKIPDPNYRATKPQIRNHTCINDATPKQKVVAEWVSGGAILRS